MKNKMEFEKKPLILKISEHFLVNVKKNAVPLVNAH